MNNTNTLFEDMILDFNFYKVREVMRFLDWTWVDNHKDVPTIANMKKVVRELYDTAMQSSQQQGIEYTAQCGGFMVVANYQEKSAVLYFTIEESFAN